MKKIFTILSLSLLMMIGIADGQYSWSVRADLGGIKRQAAVGFAIGSKGYIGTGLNYESLTPLKDFWEFDPSTNTWTQKADFGGTARINAIDFVIGNIAYVGSGSDAYPNANFVNDFWAFNPIANTWTQISSFPGTARYGASGFAIDSNGYIGTGWNQVSYFNDFWEYKVNTATWIQKASFPGNPRIKCFGFAIGSYGYMGAGADDNVAYSDMWRYNDTTNNWAQMASLPSIDDASATFVMIGKAFVGTGTTSYPALSLFNYFWSYDPSVNTWDSIAAIPGTLRLNAVAFAIDSIGYCGTGAYNNFTQDLQEFYQYAPPVSHDGINELAQKSHNISVYPNPATTSITIHSQLYLLNSQLLITDVLGNEVYHQAINNSNNQTIDITQWSNGVYFYQLINNTETVREKFVKE